jgi:hypothetical protein
MRTLTLTLLALTFPATVGAQAPAVRLTLADGSRVRGDLLAESLTVVTAYGPLVIPSSEIRSIKFGIHVADEASVTLAVKQLGSMAHKERDAATHRLTALGRAALPALRVAMKSADVETKLRAEAIYVLILEHDSGAKDATLLDVVIAKSMVATGKIQGDAMKLKSKLLGELTVSLTDCREMTGLQAGRAELVVAASKELSGEQWTETEVQIDKGQRLVIAASGSVDLYPQQQAGQYVTTPNGYSQPGRGGRFAAGALVGKIGKDGAAFVIGERFDAVMHDEGKLFVLIIANPWNTASGGTYRVVVGD